MCTLVILRRPEHRWPVIIGANRDEMIDRPAKAPARHWPDRAEVVGGLDLLAGGSWLGLNDWGVVAAVLNRTGSLGPAAGLRSRGELVLEALDHADAVDAAAALSYLDPGSYRSFNLIVADNRDGFWVRHTGRGRIEARPLPDGLSMIAAGDLDELTTRRLALARPQFLAAPPPDPDRDDWGAWQDLLVERVPFDDVERLIEVERIVPPFAGSAEQVAWHVKILLSDLIPPATPMRVVIRPQPGGAEFEVDMPPP